MSTVVFECLSASSANAACYLRLGMTNHSTERRLTPTVGASNVTPVVIAQAEVENRKMRDDMAGLPSPSTAIHPALASAGHLPLVIPMSSPNSNPIPNPDSPDRPRTSYNIRRADPTATERTEATSTETIEDEDNQRPHSAHAHFSLESIPRQTVLKALASSVARARKPELFLWPC